MGNKLYLKTFYISVMKTILIIIYVSAMAMLVSCSHKPSTPIAIESPAEILKSDTSFIYYIGANLKLLSANYTAFDETGKTISKLEFLQQLTTGNYMFINTSPDTVKLQFKLYKLNTADSARGQVIYAYTRGIYANQQWVGKKFPAFDFTDINGNRFNSDNTRGKTVVLKCWFIGCLVCRQEMPELNKLVRHYKNRNDIVFISLATDSKANLQKFFTTTHFDYLKIPNQGDFMSKTLSVQEYPTHFIINKQGIIVNVVDTPEEIAYTLNSDL